MILLTCCTNKTNHGTFDDYIYKIWIWGNNRNLVKIDFGNNCMMRHKNLVMKKCRIKSQRAAEEIREEQREIQNNLCGSQFFLCGSYVYKR
jgi:hypothetical protein